MSTQPANAKAASLALDHVVARSRTVDRYYIGVIVALLGSLVLVSIVQPGLVRFIQLSAADFGQILLPLVVVSTFIERAVEVIVTAWRGGDSKLLHNALKRAKAEQPADASAVAIWQNRIDAYKAETQKIAFALTVTFGVIIAALGLRALELFVDPIVFGNLADGQERIFRFADVVLTGAVLGGGADGIHKIFSVVVDFMDKTSNKIKTAD